MSPQEWAGFVLTLCSISGIIFGGIRWYINFQIKPIAESIEEIRKETKTNGGSSMRDEIKQIKAEQERSAKTRADYNQKLDHMYDLFIEYIAKNSK
jgi:hypothetical protein